MTEIKDLIDKSGIITSSKVMEKGISKPRFYDFLKENGFEKVGHGIYALPNTMIDDIYVLHKRCPKAVFSHDVALYYHRLVDREPVIKTMTIYSGYGISQLKGSRVKIYTVKKELLNIGKNDIITAFGHKVPMYDLERTICDLVRSRSNFEIQDYTTAIKAYVNRRNKDLNKLMEYAELFHVDKIIRGYLEVML